MLHYAQYNSKIHRLIFIVCDKLYVWWYNNVFLNNNKCRVYLKKAVKSLKE